jgi:hypothetical protein
MLTDWELWACANHYIIKHQADAAIVAAMRADELMAQGDLAGARTYSEIVRPINRLLQMPAGPLN